MEHPRSLHDEISPIVMFSGAVRIRIFGGHGGVTLLQAWLMTKHIT